MNRDVRGVFASFLVLSLIFSSSAFGGIQWGNPLPQGNLLSDVAWNGSRYVAVGNAGTIMESADGTQWNLVPSGTKAWLHAVKWTGTQFIAVGNSGTILTSPNGLQWIRQTSGTTNFLYGVEQGNTTVVVGSSGLVLTSSDTIHWTARPSGVVEWLNDVAWNQQEFIAVGAAGMIISSPDGTIWSRRATPVRTQNADGTGSGPSLEGIAWSREAGRWVVVAEAAKTPAAAAHILSSGNGVDWSDQSAGSRPLNGVIWDAAQRRFVAVGNSGLVLTSNDGVHWDPPNVTGLSQSFESVAYGAGGYVIVGEHGILLTAPDPAGGWTLQTKGRLKRMYAAAYGQGGSYVAVGDGLVMYHSAGATSGLEEITQTQDGRSLPPLRGIAAGPEGYTAVGLGGTILRSTGGSSWLVDSDGGSDLRDIVITPSGVSYAVGAEGTVRRKSPGGSWTTVRAGNEILNAVAADEAGLIAAGARGTAGVLLNSIDGNTWAERSAPNAPFLGVAAAGGRRVAVGYAGAFATFADGAWVEGNVGTTWNLNHVAWDGARFIAVGDHGMTFISGDGIHWAQQTLTGNSLEGIAASAGKFLVVGEGGTILSTSCPCAANDFATTSANTPVTIPVLANDVGDHLVVGGHDAHSSRGGTVALNGDGTLTYAPAQDFSGVDLFTYSLGTTTDPNATDTATVTINVSSNSPSGAGSDDSTGGTKGGSHRGGGGGGSAASLLGVLLLASVRKRRRRTARIASRGRA